MQYRRDYTKGASYFFTGVTFNRAPLFNQPEAVARLRTAFHDEMARRPFMIDAVVIMLNHIHAVWTLPPDDANYSIRWRNIKRSFTETVPQEQRPAVFASVMLGYEKRVTQPTRLVTALQQQQHRKEHALHRKVHRPWGWYDSIDEEDRFKVKRIQVKPKASLSLQKHYHRAEHWIVVKGTAEITCGDKVIVLTENQSNYIPLGEVHRLANPGTIPLEIIEVQTGSYLGENDIVRFEDTYGRKS